MSLTESVYNYLLKQAATKKKNPWDINPRLKGSRKAAKRDNTRTKAKPNSSTKDMKGPKAKNTTGYSDLSFGKAFGKARGKGVKEFKWKGKKYHTKTKEEMGGASKAKPKKTGVKAKDISKIKNKNIPSVSKAKTKKAPTVSKIKNKNIPSLGSSKAKNLLAKTKKAQKPNVPHKLKNKSK